MTQELGPHQKEWIAALRSGEYEQGKGALYRSGRYCCLGVGCVVAQIPSTLGVQGFLWFADNAEYAPEAVIDYLALHSQRGLLYGLSLRGFPALQIANDRGVSFSEIADFCEAHPDAVFFKPR